MTRGWSAARNAAGGNVVAANGIGAGDAIARVRARTRASAKEKPRDGDPWAFGVVEIASQTATYRNCCQYSPGMSIARRSAPSAPA
jgi:hypothetical protein